MPGHLSERTPQAEFGRAEAQSLDRLCELAAETLQAHVAVLVLQLNGVSRVIASAGIEPRFRSRFWGVDAPPFNASDDLIRTATDGHPAIEAKLAFLGLPAAGFFLRTPVIVTDTHALALVVTDIAPRKQPTAREKRLLDEVKTLVRDTFAAHASLLTDPTSDVTAAIRLDEAMAQANRATAPTALLDAEQTILAASESMAALLDTTRSELIGKRHSDVAVPMSDAIGALYRQAIHTRLSPPDFEVVQDGPDATPGVYRVTVAPFSPIETRDYFLFVTARDITDLQARERALARRIGHAEALPEPSLTFLKETLVERRAIRSRKSVSYITLRSWRTPIRDWQIKALRALKANIPPEMAATIADEMLGDIKALVGITAFRAVVPVPCGHTREGGCLSVEIARALAAKLNMPVVQAFTTQPRKASSHPKENTKRPPLVLTRPVTEPVLLIDDVATSGAHIEEAVTLLRQHTGSVLALAWISGDSA